MGLRALGDSAWLFEAGGDDSRAKLELVLGLVKLLETEAIPEVRDVVSSFDSVAVHFDPTDGERVLAWLTRLPPPPVGDGMVSGNHRIVEVPVVYGGECGPDLETLASFLGRGVREIIGLHSGAEYTVAAVGFSPGFPYLLGLPEELQAPRHDTPRKVAAGSVAIAGGQAGIYPFESQGGWHVVGRTDLRMFDPQRAEPAMLMPGDRLRFVPAERLEFSMATMPQFRTDGGMEMIEPGALTTVQDLGRPGFQKFGVSPGGAVDTVAARVANRLVGNPDEAALLECAMSGPVLEFHQPARVAWVGWADGRSGRPMEIPAGGKIDLRTRMNALRGYVAVCRRDRCATGDGQPGDRSAGGFRRPSRTGDQNRRPLANRHSDQRAAARGLARRLATCGGRDDRAAIRQWHAGGLVRRAGAEGVPKRDLSGKPDGRPDGRAARRPDAGARGNPRAGITTGGGGIGAGAAGRQADRVAGRAPNDRRLPADRPCDFRRSATVGARLAGDATAVP